MRELPGGAGEQEESAKVEVEGLAGRIEAGEGGIEYAVKEELEGEPAAFSSGQESG